MVQRLKLSPHDVGKLLLACYIVYFATYFGRTHYSSAMVAIIPEFGCTKAEAGLVSSYFYAIYAVFQIVHAVIADRSNNKAMIGISLAVSAATNLMMPFMPSIAAMKYVWMLNGIAQSAMVTHLMGICAKMVPIDMLPRTMTILITASSLGSLLSYLFSSFFISIASWKFLFYSGAVILGASTLLWFFTINKLEKRCIYEENTETTPAPQAAVSTNFKQIIYMFLSGGLIISLLITTIDGIHREGMISWFPSFVKESYNVSESFSVFIAILLPMLSFFGSPLARFVTTKIGNRASSVVRGTMFYGISLVLLVVLRFTAWSGIVVSCVIFAVLSLLMTAINVSFINNTSVEMAAYGCSALLTGILNFGYCAGSAVSGYVMGSISDKLGWTAVLDFLWIVAVVAVALGLIVSVLWTRFLKRLNISKQQADAAV